MDTRVLRRKALPPTIPRRHSRPFPRNNSNSFRRVIHRGLPVAEEETFPSILPEAVEAVTEEDNTPAARVGAMAAVEETSRDIEPLGFWAKLGRI